MHLDSRGDHAEELIQQLTADPGAANSGVLANELLREFQRGYPLQQLRPLLSSPDERIVETAIWVASELGEGAQPLLGDVVPLLRHPAKTVRFFAIDTVLSCATEANGQAVAAVLPLLADGEAAVRWKALGFLARASREQLQAALDYLHATEPDSVAAQELQWLLSAAGRNRDEIGAVLHDPEPLLRKYGVVAAARIAPDDRQPLVHAASLEDPDVRQFAGGMLQLP